jgi:beta-phosphoglucomutase
MTAPPPFAVIFDMDGVLVDSEPLNIRAYVQAWSEFGVTLDPQEYVERVTIGGMLIRSLFESHGGDPSDWDALFRRKTEIYRELVRNELVLMPGALELLTDLKANGIPRALATSASRVSVGLVFDALGLAPHFDITVALEDVTRQKPDPEAFLKAASQLQMPLDRCIVIEDAPKGIVAAKAASMKCVAIPTPLSQSSDLSAADLVVESLGQLSTDRLATLMEGDSAARTGVGA